MDDTNPLVRDMAAEALATVLKVVGDKPMSVYMDGLDKAKDAKVREACGKVELKVKSVQPQVRLIVALESQAVRAALSVTPRLIAFVI